MQEKLINAQRNMATLESASVEQDIAPLAMFLGRLVSESERQRV
jgi:hypothetical protein